MEVVAGRHAGLSQGNGRMSGDAGFIYTAYKLKVTIISQRIPDQ